MYVKIFCTVLSGILLALAYPVFNLEFFSFLAFVPLFFAIRNRNLKQAFLLAFVTGVVFWAITIYWLIHVTLIGLILLVLYLALYFGLFGIFFKLLTTNYRLSTIIIPTAWVFFEFLRSRLITGFPWALLGYSQYLNLPFIQIADIVGVWGVSFLVMMVNVVIYNCLIVIARSLATEGGGTTKQSQKRDYFTPASPSLRSQSLAMTLLFSAFLLCSVFVYGFYKLKLPITNYQLPITISLIQGNIPQHQKWDENFRDSILERYETLTKEAAKNNPDLIIWPETAVPGVIDEEPHLLARVLKLAKDVKKPILIGAVTTKITNYQLPITNYYNSAMLISSEGKIIQQYDKLHLVPFGEYVPLEKKLPFLRDLIGVPIGDFTAGGEYTIFKLEVPSLRGGPRAERGGRRSNLTNYEIASLAPSGLARNDGEFSANFAVLICFEDIIPEMSRRFVNNGAQFLVNITNDGWFMESSAPYQHAATSVFRAIENRVPVVRAANTGLSCFIDQYGRIYDKVSDAKKDIFVVGYKTQITQISERLHR